MNIFNVIKVREGPIRVVTDEKEILIEKDGDIKAFGDSHILLEGGKAYMPTRFWG